MQLVGLMPLLVAAVAVVETVVAVMTDAAVAAAEAAAAPAEVAAARVAATTAQGRLQADPQQLQAPAAEGRAAEPAAAVARGCWLHLRTGPKEQNLARPTTLLPLLRQAHGNVPTCPC